MTSIYVPHRLGPAAMEELSSVDWTVLRHAYGTRRINYLGTTHDVEATLLAVASEDDGVHAEAMASVFSMLCHQGTIYEASAHALPFLIALLAGSENPRELTLVAGAIAAIAEAASRPDAPRVSHAGAWGEGVEELTKLAIQLSADRLETCRARDPDLERLFGLVLEVGRRPGRNIDLAKAIEAALEAFEAKRSADGRWRRLH